MKLQCVQRCGTLNVDNVPADGLCPVCRHPLLVGGAAKPASAPPKGNGAPSRRRQRPSATPASYGGTS